MLLDLRPQPLKLYILRDEWMPLLSVAERQNDVQMPKWEVGCCCWQCFSSIFAVLGLIEELDVERTCFFVYYSSVGSYLAHKEMLSLSTGKNPSSLLALCSFCRYLGSYARSANDVVIK